MKPLLDKLEALGIERLGQSDEIPDITGDMTIVKELEALAFPEITEQGSPDYESANDASNLVEPSASKFEEPMVLLTESRSTWGLMERSKGDGTMSLKPAAMKKRC